MLRKSLYVMLIAVSACWIVLIATQRTTQADPPPQPDLLSTLSSSASAGRWSSEASTTPGLENYELHNNGGWIGTGSAYANVYGLFTFGDGTKKIENKTIKAFIIKSSIGGALDPVHGLGNLSFTQSTAEVEDVSVSKMGAPDADKWASSNGCFDAKSSSAYCAYDSSWW